MTEAALLDTMTATELSRWKALWRIRAKEAEAEAERARLRRGKL